MQSGIIGIYMIVNQINQKKYIGKSINIEKRIKHHYYLQNNSDYHIHRAIKKYGFDNFKLYLLKEISEKKYDKKYLDELEIFYIKKYKTYNEKYGYNKTYGGEGGKPTIETINKLSEIHKKRKHSKVSKEGRKNISESLKKVFIEKDENGKSINHPGYRKIKGALKESIKKKISKNTKIAMWKPEIRKKCLEGYKKRKNPFARKIKCIETGECFDTLTDTIKAYGNGVRKKLKDFNYNIKCGYHFEYIE